MSDLMIPMLVACLLAFAIPVQASGEQPQAYTPCVACHGAQGEGNDALDAPALAGQWAAYLERQLKNFRSGIRGDSSDDNQGAQMRAMVANLSDEDIVTLAAYLAELPVTTVSEPQKGDLVNGGKYYQDKCGACHGGRAQGNPKLDAPRLAGLDTGYFKRQYRYFQQERRGVHSDDRLGQRMNMMSGNLPGDKELDDVIAFIQSQVVAR